MGTQQLLLVVLGVIIVGIAIAISFTIFGKNAEQANKDAMVQDCLRIISVAKGYHSKPLMLGGGDHSFDGMSFSDCGMQENEEGKGTKLNGEYEITKATHKDLIIIGRSAANSLQTVQVSAHMFCSKHEERIEVVSTGWN